MTAASSSVGARITAAAPADLLYGAIISASVLATVGAHPDAYDRAVVAAATVLVIYWLAHVYVATQAGVLDGDTRHVLRRIGVAAVGESGILLGGAPALVVYVAGRLAGAGAGTAAEIGVYFSVALLVAVGYLGARRGGMTGRAAVVDAAVAGLFGVFLIAAKSLMH
jgi:hypothetical protein